jgi:hypothetical protein
LKLITVSPDVKRKRIPLRAKVDDFLGGQFVVLRGLPGISNPNIIKTLHPTLKN